MSRDEQRPTIGQEAQERSHVGRGRRHRPRGVRRAGGRCQGGVNPVVGSAGLDAHRGVARRGSDSVGWRALRPQSPTSVGGRRLAATPGRSGLGQRVPIRVPRFAMSRRARFHCGRTRRCMAIAPSMTCCCGACCMGSRAATTRRPPRRFPGRSACRGRRCPVRSFRPARRNSANSRSGTSPGRTLWPWCWTARRSPSRRWSSRWASR